MNDIISLEEISYALKKRSFMIFIIMLSSILISAIMTFFILEPKYQANAQILINQSSNSEQQSITTQELQSNRELINTYNVIITSPVILEPVIEDMNSDITVEELQEKISVSSENESQIVNLSIEDSDPEKAISIANTISNIFEQQIPEIMNIDNVSILSEATPEESGEPISPNPLLNLTTGLVVGLIGGVVVAFLIEFFDRSIRTEQDIEKGLGLPILGAIPDIEEQNGNKINNNATHQKKKRAKKASYKSN